MYNAEAYKAVLAKYEARRIRRERELEENRKKAITSVPQIETIDAELASLASAAVLKAMSSETEKAKKKAIKEFKERSVELQAQKIELLVTGGFSTDFLDEKFQCKKCQDKGFIGTKMCDCFRKELNRECYGRTKLASIIDDCTFKSFDLSFYDDEPIAEYGRSAKENMKRVYDYCREYAASFTTASPNLLLTGQPGLGKTFLSSAIAREVIDRGFYVLYESCQNILTRMENAKFKNLNDDFSDLLSCELLIIDDLGAEFKTQFSESCIYNIINSRIISKLPTVISTNLTPDEISESYHERIGSRILGEYTTVMFLGTDVRLQKLARASKKKKNKEKTER
ncbi:MAG: ATP-binding protein [Clostridia bacterium]|nr:ATP-binding protein [Clostridia bacterium]